MRGLGGGDGGDELGAGVDDAGALGAQADHEAGDVVEEEEGGWVGVRGGWGGLGGCVGEADELGGFEGFGGVDDGVGVGDDAAFYSCGVLDGV